VRQLFRENAVLLGILLAGIAVRLWRISWGLPEIYEEATPLTMAVHFWNVGAPGVSFNPHFFNYPALVFYLNFVVQAVVYGAGSILGTFRDLNAFSQAVATLTVSARMVSVLFDTGTILLAFLVAREMAGKGAGLVAAALASINPSQIRHAHLIQVDTPLTFFSLLAILYMLKLYAKPERRYYSLAGVSIGLAASCKYTGAFLLAGLLAAHVLRETTIKKAISSLGKQRLIVAVVLAVVVFVACNPSIIMSYQEFRNDFAFEQQHISSGHLGVVAEQATVGYYLLDILPADFGWLFAILLAGTIVHMVMGRKKEDLLLLVFPVVYISIISTWEMRAERYILPAVPVLIIIGSVGLLRLWRKVSPTGAQKPSWKAAASLPGLLAVSVLLMAEPAVSSYQYLRSLGYPDTRAIVKSWIRHTVKPGSAIATGLYGVDFQDTTYALLHIPFLAFEAERVAPFYDHRWYEDMDILITSSYDRDRYLEEPVRYRELLGYYDSLKTRWELIFKALPGERATGPGFWLYRCPDSLKHTTFDPSLFQHLEGSPESTKISSFLKDLSSILLKKGKLEKCEQLLREILTVEVENVSVRNTLAQVLFNMGKFPSTLNHLQISLKYDPNQAPVFALAGSALMQLGRTKEAEVVFQRALLLNGSLELPYLELINLYTAEKDKMKLTDILTRYRRILPPGSTKSEEVTRRLEIVKGMR
jgi:4-amino-4-deoxy-L-arabinose transferase-like glycosyltransferase/tetratricopeptide (TPR) repeat protein